LNGYVDPSLNIKRIFTKVSSVVDVHGSRDPILSGWVFA